MAQYDMIQKLVRKEILSTELCPTPNYWHWDVLRPEQLPDELRTEYSNLGEIRWYGTE